MDANNNGIDDSTELRARGNWNEIKGQAKQKWGNLTDDDLDYEEGKQDEWFGQLAGENRRNHRRYQKLVQAHFLGRLSTILLSQPPDAAGTGRFALIEPKPGAIPPLI